MKTNIELVDVAIIGAGKFHRKTGYMDACYGG